MTTNLDIVKRALRKLGQLEGGGVPTSDQAADAMSALQSLFAELVEQSAFGRLNDVLATAAYTANEWERVRASASVTVTLPTTITAPPSFPGSCAPNDYGARYSSLPRAPFNLAPICVIDSAGVATFSLYIAEQGAWKPITGLTQQSDFPLGSAFDDGMACLLAERIADEYTVMLGEGTKRGAALCRYMLSNKGSSARRTAAVRFF